LKVSVRETGSRSTSSRRDSRRQHRGHRCNITL
jgi:hypothetical protein